MNKSSHSILKVLLIFIIVLIVYVIPLILLNSYRNVYDDLYNNNNPNTLFSSAYTDIMNSDINTRYKDDAIIVYKATQSSIQKLQTANNVFFIYFIIVAIASLVYCTFYFRTQKNNLSYVFLISTIFLVLGILYFFIFIH